MARVFAAILDTCVLWPSLRRDFILSMAIEGLFRPLWSDAILEELHRHEKLKLLRRGIDPHLVEGRADHLIAEMRTHFDDALVTGWEGLEGTFGLPDPDDEHVVSAAVVGGAGAIVTENVGDFPRSHVPSQLQILRSAVFAADTADVDPSRAAAALRSVANRRRSPYREPEELLDMMVARYGWEDVEEILAPVM